MNSNYIRSKSYNPTSNDALERSTPRSSKLNDSAVMNRMIYRFKVILLGDVAVGKSSILFRFVDNSYSKEYKCNVGVDFKVKSLFVDENRGADLQIWDTSGEERFRTLTRQYYRDSHGIKAVVILGILLIFDLTNRNSFENLSKWLEDLNNYAPKGAPTILLGNKSDLNSERTTSFEEATTFALKHNLTYYEVSARTGNNVVLVFENLAASMIRKAEQYANETKKKDKKNATIDRSHVTANRITLDNTMIKETKNKKCC